MIVAEVEPLWLQLALGEIEFMICSEWSSDWAIPDAMPVRRESLGRFPISLIVRKDHPLLGGESEGRDFPLIISNQAEFSSQTTVAVRARLASSGQFIGDLAAARSLVQETDAIWMMSAYVVAQDIAEGVLAHLELPDEVEERSFEIFMYSLVRRTMSPSVIEIEGAFRGQIEALMAKLASAV